MKTNFCLCALFGAGVLLSLWDARFWFPVVLIVLLALWGEYNSRPGKKNEAKSRKIFETFRENVEYFDNEWMVNKELNRYPVRQLCYLRDALKKEIFHSGGSDMLLTAGEEAAMDRYNSLCREILEKVEKRIPDKYLD